MASITIRKLNPETKHRLRLRAAYHNRSMEQEAREILTATLEEEAPRSTNLAESIHRRLGKLGGVELPEVPRQPLRDPPALVK